MCYFVSMLATIVAFRITIYDVHRDHCRIERRRMPILASWMICHHRVHTQLAQRDLHREP